jgi:hypothetical protein
MEWNLRLTWNHVCSLGHLLQYEVQLNKDANLPIFTPIQESNNSYYKQFPIQYFKQVEYVIQINLYLKFLCKL